MYSINGLNRPYSGLWMHLPRSEAYSVISYNCAIRVTALEGRFRGAPGSAPSFPALGGPVAS